MNCAEPGGDKLLGEGAPAWGAERAFAAERSDLNDLGDEDHGVKETVGAAAAGALPSAVALLRTDTVIVRPLACAAAGAPGGVNTADSCTRHAEHGACGGVNITRGRGGGDGVSVMRMMAAGRTWVRASGGGRGAAP